MITTVRPQWTAPMYPGKVGRDHLGLGSVLHRFKSRRISDDLKVGFR